jgi:hypothetical protein
MSDNHFKLPILPYKMVRARGLEPPILAEPDPKSGVSANSTTRAASFLTSAKYHKLLVRGKRSVRRLFVGF